MYTDANPNPNKQFFLSRTLRRVLLGSFVVSIVYFSWAIKTYGEDVALAQYMIFRNVVYVLFALVSFGIGLLVLKQGSQMKSPPDSGQGVPPEASPLYSLLPNAIFAVITTTFVYSISLLIVSALGFLNI